MDSTIKGWEREFNDENTNPFTVSMDKDLEELFRKSIGKMNKILSEEQKE